MQPLCFQLKYRLPAPPERVWPLLADTDRLNRLLGLPRTQVETTGKEPVRVVHVTARLLGLRLQWEEEPFDFVAGRYYRVRRRLSGGPVREFTGGVEFVQDGEETEVRVSSQFIPANALGTVVVRQQWRATHRRWDRVVESIRKHLGDPETMAMEYQMDAAEPALRDATLERLRDVEPGLAREPLSAPLFDYIAMAGDVELTRIRPLALARRWKVDRYEVINLCLRAARAGVLDLSWDLICPNCRGAVSRWNGLRDIQEHAHCDDCQINFDANFDRAVEVTFRPNARYRAVDVAIFCSGGPRNTPHIVAQSVIEPGEEAAIEVPLKAGRYRLRNLDASLFSWIYADDHASNTRLQADYEAEGLQVVPANGELRPGLACVKLHNRTATRQQAILERMAASEDCLTAAAVTMYQEFRDLFSSEILSPSTQLAIQTLPLLFTDLRGSTALYQKLGDASAYALVRDHFQLLHDLIGRHHGGLVKTIGDAVMAAFPTAVDALGCALQIHHDLVQFNENARQPLSLKIGIHQGPCIAVTSYDERLDYFGSTVNLAARAHEESKGNDIVVTEEILRDPAAAALVTGRRQEPFNTTLRGIGEVRLIRICL